VYTLADPKQPAWTDKSMKKGNFLMEQKAMADLTETPGHTWTRVHPNT
jgi:hypothetical protein